MRVTVTDDFEDETAWARRLDDLTRGRVRQGVNAESLRAMRNIKIAMPVDTGRARAGWGVFTPGDLRGLDNGAGADDAVWEESDDGFTIEQGTTIVYVPRLNDGYSSQAPAGFIDTEAERAADRLADGLLELMEQVWR